MQQEMPSRVATPISVRATPEAKENLDRLTEIISRDLGTKVSKAQAFAVAVKEAVDRRIASAGA